jgi:hypothetical protein
VVNIGIKVKILVLQILGLREVSRTAPGHLVLIKN